MPALGSPLILDGATGEGGGTLIRTALAMSALTQQPFRLTNARGAQTRQGLLSEDLTVLRALALSCQAEVVGAEMGSTQFSFLPTRVPRALNERLEPTGDPDGKAHANANVVLSALAPVLARTGGYSTLFAVGETFGRHVLGFDSFAQVTLTAWRRQGLYAYADMPSAGFGLSSRGEVALEIEPSVLQGLDWQDRGKLRALRGLITTAELPESVGARGIEHLDRLCRSSGMAIDCEAIALRSKTPGAQVTVWAEYDRGLAGFAAYGQRGVRIETIAQQATDAMLHWQASDATVDDHLADQILVNAVMSEEPSVFRVQQLTSRILTMVWVVKQFLPIHVTVKGSEGKPGTITVRR